MSSKITLHMDPYERTWLTITFALLVIFAVIVTIAGFFMGIQVPAPQGRVNPQTVAADWADRTVLREISPHKYEVYILARTWQYTPNEITVPQGSEVTFHVTSVDYQHGFKLQGTNINVQVLPGHVSTMTTTFDKAGEYQFVCTEYCGSGHAIMAGKVIVTAP